MIDIFGKKELPVVVLEDILLFPFISIGLTTKESISKEAILNATQKDNKAIFVTKKNIKAGDTPQNLYGVGTIGTIVQMHSEDGNIRAVVEGEKRVRIIDFTQTEPFLKVSYDELHTIVEEDKELLALRNNFTNQFKKYVNLGKIIPIDILITILTTRDIEKLVDIISAQVEGELPEKQAILEEANLKNRLILATKMLTKAISMVELEQKVSKKTQEELSKMQRELFLREELKTIQRELGETEETEYQELERKIAEAYMPKEVEEKAKKEFARLKAMPSMSPEVGYIRTYLDLLVELPWAKETEAKLDIKEAEKILDEDHYGLEKAKERVAEYLAVQKLAGKIRGPILCFVGPPGTGKTSIGRSIARATGRKFVRISLGGIRDEAEIRGHRRTYVGALPGRIIQGIKQAGTKNPVFMLDEIDKIGLDFRGDPSASLLEVLDPEQNFQFSDHYLEVSFDLSNVIFITTANILDTIPPALRDRMETIPFPGYTHEEKVKIAEKFLVPKQLKANGLSKKELNFTNESLDELIAGYTFEAGVRDMERNIAAICRKVAKDITEKKKPQKDLYKKDLKHYLGPSKFAPWTREKKAQIGSAAALAVTPAGGDLLSVESTIIPGKEIIILTGQLGDVMKESATAALSYAKSKIKELGLSEDFFRGKDVHVHVPSGAVPKDGPSAGIAIATSLISAASKKPVKEDIAMTGEITLRGRVLRIGGLKDKVLAAHRAGMHEVILPEENKGEVGEIPKNVRRDMKIFFVKNMDEVQKEVLK